MSTLRIYSSCQKCKRLERELEAAQEVITWLVDGVPEYPMSNELRAAVEMYGRVRAELSASAGFACHP